MFYSLQELAKLASSQHHGSIADLMITTEIATSGRTKSVIMGQMKYNLSVMKASLKKGLLGGQSVTKLTGGDAKKLNEYLEQGDSLSGVDILSAVRNAIAINEVNAQMGLVCATPTAGSAGCVPAVLFSATKKLNLSEREQLNFLFTAGAIGLVIANNASISGAFGGCQAEVGSASAMSAAALVQLKGGTAEQAINAVALTLKNVLGLICDPVAGLVEIPCIKRNALGASLAFISADMSLAGIVSAIPPDEVVNAMYQVGEALPAQFKETAEGGLATTITGRKMRERVFGKEG